MKLVLAATFGSLSEATIAFSSLSSAGFNPVAAFNMNTPGTASGMAPSAYPVLVPEAEERAASQFLSELLRDAVDAPDQADEDDDPRTRTTLSHLRSVARYLVVGLLLAWLLLNCLSFIIRFR